MTQSKKKTASRGNTNSNKGDMHKPNPKAEAAKPQGALKDRMKEGAQATGKAISSGFTKAKNWVFSLVKRENINKYSGMVRSGLALGLFACSVVLGVQKLLALFTLAQVAIGCAIGVVITYGIYRLSLNPVVRASTNPSIKEMLIPMAA